MSFGKHILIGVGVGGLLYPFLKIYSMWFLISFILIDIDHYIGFILKTRFRYFNPKIMFNYYDVLLKWKHRKDILGISALHTLEFLVLMAMLICIFKSQILIVLLSGFLFHMICDFIFLWTQGVAFGRANSFLEYFFRKYYMRKQGIDTERGHQDAIEFSLQSNRRQKGDLKV